MATNNITEIVFILDRSGSMAGLEKDTIGGFNSLIEKQKKEEGTAYISTVLFDNDSEVLHDRLPLDKIKPMTEEDYVMFADNMMNTIAYEMEYGTQLAEAEVSDEDIINYLIYTGVSAEHIELSK